MASLRSIASRAGRFTRRWPPDSSRCNAGNLSVCAGQREVDADEVEFGWSIVADGFVGGAFDTVGVVSGAFDNAGAGALAAAEADVAQDFRGRVGQGGGQAFRGKEPPGR